LKWFALVIDNRFAALLMAQRTFITANAAVSVLNTVVFVAVMVANTISSATVVFAETTRDTDAMTTLAVVLPTGNCNSPDYC
jgi:hypothetical protein